MKEKKTLKILIGANIVLMGIVAVFLVYIQGFLDSMRNMPEFSIENIQGVDYYPYQENLYVAEECEDYFYDYDGEKIPAQNGSLMSNWIPCAAGDTLTRNGTATNVVCFFDRDKNFISRQDSYGFSTITVPEDERISYVRMAVQPGADRMIVYGDKIAEISIPGGYYTIPGLKVNRENFSREQTIIQSPNGTKYRISVTDDGRLTAVRLSDDVIDSGRLPRDFPKYTVTGASVSDEDFLVTISNRLDDGGSYIFIMDCYGNVKWYKKLENYAFNFRKIQYADGTVRYAYMQTDGNYIPNTNIGVLFCHLVIMDENMTVIRDNVTPLPVGSLDREQTLACESHDYKILSDDHYILTAVSYEQVDNIPGYEGEQVYVLNNIIQEQKNGEVLMHWESKDYPELYEASVTYNDYRQFTRDNFTESQSPVYTDYIHINSLAVDPKTYDILVSARHIGLFKLDRQTGRILWIMGRGHSDIKVEDEYRLPFHQHDASYLEDGSITIFDNEGADGYARVCRYIIDEKKLVMKRCESLDTTVKSYSMGGARLLNRASDTYQICFGANDSGYAFEERNFAEGRQTFTFKFEEGYSLYRIFQGVEKTPVKSGR